MIVTNAHVLRDALDGQAKGSSPIMVSLQDERVFEARVLRCDRRDPFRDCMGTIVRFYSSETLVNVCYYTFNADHLSRCAVTVMPC